MGSYYDSLRARWARSALPGSAWLKALCDAADRQLATSRHGDLQRWLCAVDALPETRQQARLDRPAPELGAIADAPEQLHELLMVLHPWRKGPLQLGGVKIDTEWRSDWKWQRVEPHVSLPGHRVLDIGCGNGYFGLRMLGAGAELVVGIDPMLVFVMQWLACRHFSGDIPNYVLPLGIEQLPQHAVTFDMVFSMGVLYHRRDHLHHLRRIRSLLEPGGQMVLETLILPAEHAEEVLVPQGRYARMRNVWSVPGVQRLQDWVAAAGFQDIELADVTVTSTQEQRSSPWMHFESLDKSLDPHNPALTVEGHPAPTRALIIARK